MRTTSVKERVGLPEEALKRHFLFKLSVGNTTLYRLVEGLNCFVLFCLLHLMCFWHMLCADVKGLGKALGYSGLCWVVKVLHTGV